MLPPYVYVYLSIYLFIYLYIDPLPRRPNYIPSRLVILSFESENRTAIEAVELHRKNDQKTILAQHGSTIEREILES